MAIDGRWHRTRGSCGIDHRCRGINVGSWLSIGLSVSPLLRVGGICIVDSSLAASCVVGVSRQAGGLVGLSLTIKGRLVV